MESSALNFRTAFRILVETRTGPELPVLPGLPEPPELPELPVLPELPAHTPADTLLYCQCLFGLLHGPNSL